MKKQIITISAVWCVSAVVMLAAYAWHFGQRGFGCFHDHLSTVLFWMATLAMSILGVRGKQWPFRMLGVSGASVLWFWLCEMSAWRDWIGGGPPGWYLPILLSSVAFSIYTIVIAVMEIKGRPNKATEATR